MKRLSLFIPFIILISWSTMICAETHSLKSDFTPVFSEMNVEAKRAARKAFLPKLITKYTQNQTFHKMHSYMIKRYAELNKQSHPPLPDQLIIDTLDKTQSVFEKTKSIVGNRFKRQYDPEIIETNINKYLWLKGLCFFILGIGDEHKIAVTYFFEPGNERIKQEFLLDTVKYSYPEVQDTPVNAAWFAKMTQVMERVAYRVFSIETFITK
ncbi:MAG TPA: hypothetical protein PLC07_07850 [Bacillota bacterium]|nr:hypothetical protein [Bacillota bacterium]HPT87209.1 hypothetical protein [Bacillota bacterium]